MASALHALPLIWASFVLPWRAASWFTLVIGSLGLLHLALFALAFTAYSRVLALIWKVLSLYSLLVLAAITWIALTSAIYLAQLYGGVGRAVAGGLFGAWAVCALLTLPISCWGLSRTWKVAPLLGRRIGLGLGATFVVAALASSFVTRKARAHELEAASLEAFERAVKSALPRSKPARRVELSLSHSTPARCAEAIDQTKLTLLLTSLDREGGPVAHCLQARDESALARRVQQVLAEGAPNAPALLDLVTAVRPIPRLYPLLDAFSLRPAQDGVCAERRCLAPWQLVALDAFAGHRPLPPPASAGVGVSLEWLTGVFQARRDELVGIHTQAYRLDAGELEPSADARDLDRPKTLATALRLAERHIVAAQQKSGAFRYKLDPFSGHTDVASVNIPRQAGTALVLCEIGAGRQAEKAARRALTQLAGYEQGIGELTVLTDVASRAKLGSTALPLAALLTCRERVGGEHDELIVRLGRGLRAFQRPDGGFFPLLDTARGAAHGRHESFYASGQAVLALVLLEQAAPTLSPMRPDEREAVKTSVERAMTRYASSYWPPALRDLFFLEENWHCLAARAALASHRHDEYERFCSDYVSFKSRLILGELEGAAPDRVGGYSLSNVFPPHTTASAGFAEALTAAIAVKRARHEDTAEDEALLKRVLTFVLRQQWTPERCLACAPGKEAVGGFSESQASGIIRIDYVQHAMAALGHGGRVLGLLP